MTEQMEKLKRVFECKMVMVDSLDTLRALGIEVRENNFGALFGQAKLADRYYALLEIRVSPLLGPGMIVGINDRLACPITSYSMAEPPKPNPAEAVRKLLDGWRYPPVSTRLTNIR